jgi:hypothetical protein
MEKMTYTIDELKGFSKSDLIYQILLKEQAINRLNVKIEGLTELIETLSRDLDKFNEGVYRGE